MNLFFFFNQRNAEIMTGTRGTGRKASNNASQPPNGSRRRRTAGFESLCTIVDDLCNSFVDNDDAVIPRIQEMLRDQPGLYQNSATAVAFTQLLLPVMGMTH